MVLPVQTRQEGHVGALLCQLTGVLQGPPLPSITKESNTLTPSAGGKPSKSAQPLHRGTTRGAPCTVKTNLHHGSQDPSRSRQDLHV